MHFSFAWAAVLCFSPFFLHPAYRRFFFFFQNVASAQQTISERISIGKQ